MQELDNSKFSIFSDIIFFVEKRDVTTIF